MKGLASVESRLLRFSARMKGKSMRKAESLSFSEIGVAIGSDKESVTEEYFRSPLIDCSERWTEKLLVKLDREGRL